MYNKLFTKILDSSVWLESTTTRIVWLTFIAAMDETGFAQFAAPANVAHRARVTMDEVESALACLEGPDAVSPHQEHEGRRIERVPGGWMVLNAEKYRDLVTRAVQQQQTRERVRRFRSRLTLSNAPVTVRNAPKRKVTKANDRVTPSEAYTEAETEKNKNSAAASPRDSMKVMTKLAHELIGTSETPNFADLKDSLKAACAKHHITYDSEIAGAALESALAQRPW